ncbi:MAG: GNAT family N-acetyltransferase [Candidatus Bathyarchaeia archaeon]
MVKIEKVNVENRFHVINFLRNDPVKHVFALYDLQYEWEKTEMYVAFDDKNIVKGYLLIYKGLAYPSVILEGDVNIAEKLLTFLQEERFILHVSPELLSPVEGKYPDAKSYVEDWMIVKRGEMRPFPSNKARKLRLKDAERLAELYATFPERPNVEAKLCRELIRNGTTYGIFAEKKLVSTARAWLQLPEVWLIGGVLTHPDYRNRGYATEVVSALTAEALDSAKAAVLFVRSDNEAAKRVYLKIGYKKIGERIWVDIGTGMKP